MNAPEFLMYGFPGRNRPFLQVTLEKLRNGNQGLIFRLQREELKRGAGGSPAGVFGPSL